MAVSAVWLSPSGLASSVPRPASRRPGTVLPQRRVFELLGGCGRCPQIRRVFGFHRLGTVELSRLCPQGGGVRDHLGRWEGCGFVDKCYPQGVDKFGVHRMGKKLSTGFPQVGARFPQGGGGSPQRCPLFGNPTHLLTGSSEMRHMKVPGCPVGNVGKPGDAVGDKWARSVDRVCITFRSPQTRWVIHRRRPQDRWIKFAV